MAIEPYTIPWNIHQNHQPMWVSCSTLFWCQATQQMLFCFGTGFCFCTCTVGKTSLRVNVPSVLSAELDSKRVGSLKKRIQSKLKTYCSTVEKKYEKSKWYGRPLFPPPRTRFVHIALSDAISILFGWPHFPPISPHISTIYHNILHGAGMLTTNSYSHAPKKSPKYW